MNTSIAYDRPVTPPESKLRPQGGYNGYYCKHIFKYFSPTCKTNCWWNCVETGDDDLLEFNIRTGSEVMYVSDETNPTYNPIDEIGIQTIDFIDYRWDIEKTYDEKLGTNQDDY